MLTPWTRTAVPHRDILEEDFDLSTYAANLGDVDRDAGPAVYRDPVAFWNATYMTEALESLLKGTAAVVSGKPGNRVLQLRTPFGGGKTHSLIAMLHLFRRRATLAGAGLLEGYADPGPETRVVVLPCLELDAAGGRLADGQQVRTLWGELAHRLGDHDALAEADEQRVAPGSESLRALLERHPTVILLDEALAYMEAASGVRVGDSTLAQQTMVFLQNLTEVVRSLKRGALVYSLQRSVGEAYGSKTLLNTLDHLVSRVDSKKEPVRGGEVLQVVRQRLFAELGPKRQREQVAKAYGQAHTAWLRSTADTDADKKRADQDGAALAKRIEQSYPFHPALLDLMYHRWGSLPSYQRTRGALQFLATVVGALHRSDAGGALIGPGDIPFDDPAVKQAFFSQVGESGEWESVMATDLVGSTARSRDVDAKVGLDAPKFRALAVGTRLARALMAYSFGASSGEKRGVTSQDLVGAVQRPDLPYDVLEQALLGVAARLLYVHGGDGRYRFETRPNLNKLLEDEAAAIQPHAVDRRVEELFAKRIGSRNYVLWPAGHKDVPDRRPRFTVVFWHLRFSQLPQGKLVEQALLWTEQVGDNKREYKNALCFAAPDGHHVDRCKHQARQLLAVEELLRTPKRFAAEDLAELRRRKDKAGAGVQAGLGRMYRTLLLPRAAQEGEAGPIGVEIVPVQEHHGYGAQIMKTLHEQLDAWVFPQVRARKLVSAVALGSGDLDGKGHWISGTELVGQFFGSVLFPKLFTEEGIRHAVAAGVKAGLLAYAWKAAIDGERLKAAAENIEFRRELEPSEVDLGRDSYVISAALAERLTAKVEPPGPTPPGPTPPGPTPPGPTPPGPTPHEPIPGDLPPVPPTARTDYRFTVRAQGAQIFDVLPALVLLQDWATEKYALHLNVYAQGTEPLPEWTKEALIEALEQAGVDIQVS